MEIDDSFKKPGAIPFEWEIRPGIPKLQQATPRSTSPSHHLHRSLVEHHQHKQNPGNHSRLSHPPLKLRPPPARFNFPTPEPQLRVRSSRSIPRTRLGHDQFDPPNMAEVVESGCFTTSGLLLKRNDSKKKTFKSKSKIDPEPDYTRSDHSESTLRSISQFQGSPFLLSFSSNPSSPCLFRDPKWVGFGLF